MNASKTIALLVLFACFHVQCHSSKKTTIKSYCSSIKLEKGGCLAKCKSYTIQIVESGLAEYAGKANVSKTGKHYRTISDNEKTDLWSFMKENDVFNLTGFIGGAGEDSQARLLVIVKDGQEKKISYGQMAPKVLMDLEGKIEKIAESGEWKKR